MKITNNTTENYKEIILEGRLDTKAVAEGEQNFIAEITDDSSNFLINCENLNYISSSGLRVFLKIQKLTNSKNYKLIIHSMPENIYEIFKMCNFTTIFKIVDTLEDAVKNL